MITKKHRMVLSARMRKRWSEQRESMIEVAKRGGKAAWAGPKNRARQLAASRKSMPKAILASKIARTGRPMPAEHKAGISVALKGKKKSQEHCESFRKAWAEGRRKYSPMSSEARKRRSKRLRALWKSGAYKSVVRWRRSEVGRERMSEVRSHQVFPFKDTKPELKVQQWLDSKSVFYIPHVVCKWVKTRHQWDLYLPEDKLLIEINGCYWHGCREHFPDKKMGKFDLVLSQYRMIARRQGWDILVLWEHDIKSGAAFNLLGSLIDGYRKAA